MLRYQRPKEAETSGRKRVLLSILNITIDPSKGTEKYITDDEAVWSNKTRRDPNFHLIVDCYHSTCSRLLFIAIFCMGPLQFVSELMFLSLWLAVVTVFNPAYNSMFT